MTVSRLDITIQIGQRQITETCGWAMHLNSNTGVEDPVLANGVRQSGKSLIEKERDALDRLAQELPAGFEEAVLAILQSSGRAVITGVGKSGLIGRKLAATFSATGTPAFFLHAAEASHGDLGMIKPEDLVVAISNSGASSELQPILDYATDFGVPVIGIASRADCPLFRRSTIRLQIPNLPEACPEQIAPTTSTAMMMALGDALAISAMKARGVNRNILVNLHPGGAIGFGNTPVGQLLVDAVPPPLVAEDSPMRDVVPEITAGCKGIAGVVDAEGRLVGVITDGDLRRAMDRLLNSKARDEMTRNPVVITEDMAVSDALQIMVSREITSIFIVDGLQTLRPLGALNIHDLSKFG
mgnify:CR=1 FL=1